MASNLRNRIAGIRAASLEATENPPTSHQQREISSESFSEPDPSTTDSLLAQQIRLGILDIMQRYVVKEDALSNILMRTLKRFLNQGKEGDLVMVLLAAKSFTDEMSPHIPDGYFERFTKSQAIDAQASDMATVGDMPQLRDTPASTDGSSANGGNDSLGEVDTSQTVDRTLLEEISPWDSDSFAM